MRRRKASSKNQHVLQQQRASFPLARPQMSESRAAHNLEQQLSNMSSSLSHNGDIDSSSDRLEEGMQTLHLHVAYICVLSLCHDYYSVVLCLSMYSICCTMYLYIHIYC